MGPLNLPGLQVAGQPAGYDIGTAGLALNTGNGFSAVPAGALQAYGAVTPDQGGNTLGVNTDVSNAGLFVGSGTGPTAGATVDPTIYNYLDQLTNNANTQSNNANQSVTDSYNQAYNKLLGSKAIADRNYQQNKDQTLQDNVLARGNIQAGVGQTANSLQRLLGAHGAGNSSAARFAAPYAAALTGAQQNNQVQNAYGRNQQALDTTYGDYNNSYNGSLADLATQKQSNLDKNKTDLLTQLSSIAQQRAQVAPGATYGSVVSATQPIQDQINAIGAQRPTIQAPTPAYQAPTLQSYDYSRAPAAQINQPGANSAAQPFLGTLLSAQQDKNKQLGA
jgi:hypothetical protein